jgi:hypothetical protein
VIRNRTSFKLAWRQGDEKWGMEGIGNKVVLWPSASDKPEFITWSDRKSAEPDRISLKKLPNGQILIDIPFNKALLRTKDVQNTTDESKVTEMLPVVHS